MQLQPTGQRCHPSPSHMLEMRFHFVSISEPSLSLKKLLMLEVRPALYMRSIHRKRFQESNQPMFLVGEAPRDGVDQHAGKANYYMSELHVCGGGREQVLVQVIVVSPLSV